MSHSIRSRTLNRVPRPSRSNAEVVALLIQLTFESNTLATIGDNIMPKGVLVTLSRPIQPHKREAYNDWYSNQHAPELLKVPGVTSVRRFEPIDERTGELDLDGLYLAVVELEGENLAAVKQAIVDHNGPEMAHVQKVVDPAATVHIFSEI
jgi:hypothetical protein